MSTAIEYLSDLEKTKVDIFNNDSVMKEAVRKVLLAGIYLNGTLVPVQQSDPLRNWALSFGSIGNPLITDEVLGQNLRSYSWALNAIESAFDQLSKVVVEVPEADKPDKANPAL